MESCRGPCGSRLGQPCCYLPDFGTESVSGGDSRLPRENLLSASSPVSVRPTAMRPDYLFSESRKRAYRFYTVALRWVIVVAAILHYGFRFYVSSGTSSFLCKVVIGWLGAWLGSPVFGHWLEGLRYESVYYIPAVLGSLALVLLAVDMGKSGSILKGW